MFQLSRPGSTLKQKRIRNPEKSEINLAGQMEFFSGIQLGETGGGDTHASLMISALLRTIMITLTMMRMRELRAKPEPKENKQYIENNKKS
jgi:hypothetical protein